MTLAAGIMSAIVVPPDDPSRSQIAWAGLAGGLAGILVIVVVAFGVALDPAAHLAACQFPEQMTDAEGAFHKPPGW